VLQLSVKDFMIEINCNATLKKNIDDLLSQNDEIIYLMNGGSKKKEKNQKNIVKNQKNIVKNQKNLEEKKDKYFNLFS